MAWIGKAVGDRRVQRTQRLLHDALGALIHEKPYDAIAVKEILDRANVGRSTFYAHFRDKDELLVSGLLALLHARRPKHRSPPTSGPDVLWFSRPMFEHVDQRRGTSAGRMEEANGRSIVHEHVQRAIVGLVLEELDRYWSPADAQRRLPPALLARHVAATFVLVLDWWVESGSELTATEIDDRFRGLMQPAIEQWTPAARSR